MSLPRNDSDNIAQITGLSAASLAANGLTTSSTVGQWRQTIINKLGSATANQSCSATIGEKRCTGCDREWRLRWRWLLLAVARMRSGFSRAVRFPGTNVIILTPRRLKLTPEDAWEGKGFPPVFKGPSEDSGKLGVGVGRGLRRLAVTEAKWVCSDPEVWRRRRMDFGVCDQATISRAWIERRLHFVVAR